MLCDLLSPKDRIKSPSDWEEIYGYVSRCSCSEITTYELYLVLAQECFPVPTYVLDKILNRNTDLVKNDETFQMYCLLAYSSEHTPFTTMKHLLDASGRSFQLANVLLRKSLGADFGRFDVARALIRYQPALLSYMDGDGNMPIHECCLNCESPAMVQLLIDEELAITGNWLPQNFDGMTAIDIALECECLESANGILSILLHASPNFPTNDQVLEHELLHVAARINDVYCARQILQVYPGCIHSMNKEQFLPLHLACLYGLPNMIEFLLGEEIRLGVRSAVVAVYTCALYAPLQLACFNQRSTLGIIKSLMNSNPESVPQSSAMLVWRFKLLHIAAMGSNPEIARYFLELFPLAIAITSDTGCLPIRLACQSGSADMVELLLTAGQQYDEADFLLHVLGESYAESTIQLACSNPKMSARVLRLLFHEAGISMDVVLRDSLLNRTISAGNVECAQMILSAVPNILSHRDHDLNLPLHVACISGSTDMIRFIFRKSFQKLLSSKELRNWDTVSASIYQKNLWGVTPWDLLCHSFSSVLEVCGYNAFFGGTWPCIKLILNLKAGLMKWQPSGSLPLYHAAIMTITHKDMLHAVILNGITQSNPCVIDCRGRTALHVIAGQLPFNPSVRREVIEYLLSEENGTTCASMRDVVGSLPLHIAAANMSWSEGTDCILEANSLGNDQVEQRFGFYPFQLAATSTESNLDSVYELLRFSPNLLENVLDSAADQMSMEII